MTFSRQAYSYIWGYTLRKYQGENLRSDSTLPIRSLLHDLVTGGIPHAGTRHSWERFAENDEFWAARNYMLGRNLAEGIWHTEIQDPLSQGTNGNQSLTRWISFCVFFLLMLVVSWVLSERQHFANFFFFFYCNSALSPLSLLTFSQGLMQLTLYF